MMGNNTFLGGRSGKEGKWWVSFVFDWLLIMI